MLYKSVKYTANQEKSTAAAQIAADKFNVMLGDNNG